MNNKWNINFLQNCPLVFYTLTPVSFPLVKAHFWYCGKLYPHISFNVVHVLKTYPWKVFSVYQTRKSSIELSLVGMESVAYAQSCISSKTTHHKVMRLLIKKNFQEQTLTKSRYLHISHRSCAQFIYVFLFLTILFLLYLYQIVDSGQQPTSFATLHCELLSFMSFIILFIVLIDNCWSHVPCK